MSTVQLFNREEREAEKFDGLNARHRDANLDANIYYAVFYPVIELIQTIGIALIVWYGGGQVLRSTLSVGALIAFFQYAQRFYKLPDPPLRIQAEGALEVSEFQSIEFRNVSFAYNGEDWVLKNVSFR